MSDERDAFLAIADGRPVGFVTVALHAFTARIARMTRVSMRVPRGR